MKPVIYVFGTFGIAGRRLVRAIGGDDPMIPGKLVRDIPYPVVLACDSRVMYPGYDDPVWVRPLGRRPEIEGQIITTFLPMPTGWSYVTWWDRQGDKRNNSHTGLLAEGTWRTDELLSAGRDQAPWAFRVQVTS